MSYSVKHRQKLQRIRSLLLKPFVKMQNLRSDEHGSVLLLTGMMAFVAAIFALMAMDTSQAIYNRIIVQNSVDAAADAAALWQARGCNMVQNLNNYHYEANMFFAQTEATALNACSLAAVLEAGKLLPPISELCAAAKEVVCFVCRSAPVWDDAQNLTAAGILTEQKLITASIPFIALTAANDAAQGSGADELIASVNTWLNQSTASIGFPLPDLSSISSALSNILGKFGITVYALPLDPTSLELGVQPTSGSGSPWEFGPCTLEVDIGQMPEIGCGLKDPSLDFGPEEQHPRNWGWRQDQYYVGQPGFMTWIAGKTNQTELAGLGFLRWLNPNPAPPGEIPYWMNQSNLPMYKDSVMASSELVIPAFIAFASSQVDGSPGTKWNGVGVDASETPRPPNAYPYLIPVYLPVVNKPASDLLIYH